MPIPELNIGCIIWDLVVLYILTPDEDREEETRILSLKDDVEILFGS